MTKEEIVDNIVRDWATPITRPDAYEAMDEFAKQQCIVFGDYLNRNYELWGVEWSSHQTGRTYSTQEVYAQFIESQNNNTK